MINRREKYLNAQLEAPLAELRTLSDNLAASKEQYRWVTTLTKLVERVPARRDL